MRWFRATWQHGGSATGWSTWQANDGRTIPCVVKLPVNYSEYFWTKRLGLVSTASWDADTSKMLPTPRVLAAGFELGGYDLAWIVIEKLNAPGATVRSGANGVRDMFDCAAEFHAAAVTERAVEPERTPESPDWGELLERSARAVREHELEPTDAWQGAIDRVSDGLGCLTGAWDARPIDTWCHADLHARNTMRRDSGDPDRPGRCVLIDLAMVHPGNWIEDALYFERLTWGHPEQLFGVDPVECLARARDFIGLPTGDYHELVRVRRVLMAATAPAFLRTEGDPAYLKAALEVLERGLAEVA